MKLLRLVILVGFTVVSLGNAPSISMAVSVPEAAPSARHFVPMFDDDDEGDDDDFDDDDFDDGGGSPNSGPGNANESDDGGHDGVVVPEVDDDDDEKTDGYRSMQAIVRLQPKTDVDAFNSRHGTSTVGTIPSRDLYLMQLPSDRSEVEVERDLSSDPDTRWTELNYVAEAPEGRPGYFFVSGVESDRAVEPYATELLRSDVALTCGAAEGIIVAVLDTGIDASHPDLASNMLVDAGWNALTGTQDTRDIGNGADDDDDGMVDEMVGHGTHVAGIITMIAPRAKIMPVKVLSSDGQGDAFYVAAGIYHAIDNNADVINLSLGSTNDARVVAEAVAEASELGIVVVAAAGNASTDRPIEFPAGHAGVISVAATDSADLKTDFSNFGAQIDISAPGLDIVSTLPGGRYANWSGTSMAVPFVSATAALVAEAHPSWSSPQIASRLGRTAHEIDEINPDFAGQLGAGRLDVAAAIRCEPVEGA